MVVPAGHYRFGPENGRLLLHTGRAGLAGSLGHDLTIEVTAWSAEVEVGDDPATAQVSAWVDLSSLTVLEGQGGAKALRSGDRREIEANARKSLDVVRFPRAGFESIESIESIEPGGSASGTVVAGTLTLHGRSGPQQLELEEIASRRYRARGTVVQSQFGITPYSTMFGALKVRDDVAFEVEVRLDP
jgi:polyisoprenoid-binding protein YceI